MTQEIKPIIIYTMPRTRSTAMLEAAKRKNKFLESFDYHVLYPNLATSDFFGSYAKYSNITKREFWPDIVKKLSDPNSAIKFFGRSLFWCYPAREWFNNADLNKTHDIFVLVRDLREQALSLLLADKLGFSKHAEISPHDITLKNVDIMPIFFNIDNFLRFFPKNARLVTWETLPNSHFDKSQCSIKEQHSLDKLKYITNLDWCLEQIDEIIKCYQDEWDEKINSINQG